MIPDKHKKQGARKKYCKKVYFFGEYATLEKPERHCPKCRWLNKPVAIGPPKTKAELAKERRKRKPDMRLSRPREAPPQKLDGWRQQLQCQPPPPPPT